MISHVLLQIFNLHYHLEKDETMTLYRFELRFEAEGGSAHRFNSSNDRSQDLRCYLLARLPL